MLTTADQRYRHMLAEDRHERPDAYDYVTGQLFRGVSLAGARVLEIGSGTGLLSIYMAAHGAHVLSLEPEGVGATAGVIARQRERCRQLGLDGRVSVLDADFHTWTTDARFDVIVARNVINHLYPSTRHALHDQATRNGYLASLRRVRARLAPGGVFIAADACRYAFFTLARDFGVRRPWRPGRPGVNWRHHQNPLTWRRLLREAGFADVEIAYPVPYRLRRLGPLVDTAFANFFLRGSFILRAR